MVSILFSWLECTSVAPLPTLHPYLFFPSTRHGQRCGSDMESQTGDSYFSSWFCHGPTVKQTASSVGYIKGRFLVAKGNHASVFISSDHSIYHYSGFFSMEKNLSFMIWGSCFPDSCGLLGKCSLKIISKMALLLPIVELDQTCQSIAMTCYPNSCNGAAPISLSLWSIPCHVSWALIFSCSASFW